MSKEMHVKPLSVTKNVVVLQTDDEGHVGQNSSAHVACVVGLQTDAVAVTETRLKYIIIYNSNKNRGIHSMLFF